MPCTKAYVGCSSQKIKRNLLAYNVWRLHSRICVVVNVKMKFSTGNQYMIKKVWVDALR